MGLSHVRRERRSGLVAIKKVAVSGAPYQRTERGVHRERGKKLGKVPSGGRHSSIVGGERGPDFLGAGTRERKS